MDKISAAHAMAWSIDLEKGLRSQKPGQSVKSILQAVQRLQQWNTEAKLTTVECNIFGLVLGEDRLFASTILLRLADAFRSGDKETRVCVVKVFMSMLRHCGGNSNQNDGSFSKQKISNQKEVLRRIKAVYFTGNVESRSLALALFGCWATFARDEADIRYFVLSGLVSSHDLEVRASLFAAGCFCKVSDDFGSLAIEMVVKIVMSSEALLALRLAATQVFSKMGCSIPLANKVYKIGVKLARSFSEESLLLAMLISLSQLASISTILISKQVDLLFSLLTSEATLKLQITTLRCLRFLYRRGLCYSPISSHSLQKLFNMLDAPEGPFTLQAEALQVLYKILLYGLPDLFCLDVLECQKLLKIAENNSIVSFRLLALRVLIILLAKFRGTEMGTGGACTYAHQALSLVFGRINILVKVSLDFNETDPVGKKETDPVDQKETDPVDQKETDPVDQKETDPEVKREFRSLLKLLFVLVKHYPDLSVLVIDEALIVIESLVKSVETVAATGRSFHVIHDLEAEKAAFIMVKFTVYVCKFLMACTKNIGDTGQLTAEVLRKGKLVAEHACCCSSFDHYTRGIYSLLFHFFFTCDFQIDGGEDTHYSILDSVVSRVNDVAERELIALECTKELLAARDNWSAYRAGKFAACQGAWCTAALVFDGLMVTAESTACCCWLKSLAQFSYAEMHFKLLLMHKDSRLIAWLGRSKISLMPPGDQPSPSTGSSLNYLEKLADVCHAVQSSVKTLGNTSDQVFCFQRWFLALRGNVIESVVDILRLLDTIGSNLESIRNDEQTDASMMIEKSGLHPDFNSCIYHLTQISLQLKRLAQEFDLIATSFIDIDERSLNEIYALALGCSTLAFCTGLALFIPNGPSYNNSACSSAMVGENAHALLIQNLIDRLWHSDPKIIKNLRLILELTGNSGRCYESQKHNLSIGSEANVNLSFCNHCVRTFFELHSGVNKEILSQITQGRKFLLDAIRRWMCTPFQIPECFFRVRPCVGSELFAFNENSRDGGGISILSGFHLSLDLCLQTKNMPSKLLAQNTRLYCILYCSKSFVISGTHLETEHATQDFHAWRSDNIVDLKKKLFEHVVDSAEGAASACCENVDTDVDDAIAFASFEPNRRGQGFSTCLLDVSNFPAGSYRIRWHSCCSDDQGRYWSLLPLNNGPVFTVTTIS